MADYLVWGKKGAGKSLFCVGKIRQALRDGKKVATNLNIFLDVLLPPQSKAHYIRLPDRPGSADLEAIGPGCETYDEDDFGILVLDETSMFFNARAWSDKDRQPILDWLAQSRKKRWEVFFIAQGAAQIDKQVRDTQIEYSIAVKNTAKWPIPFIGSVVRSITGYQLRWPKFHLGIMRQGLDSHALFIGREWFLGKELYPAYDTTQVFLERSHPAAVGLHSVLSAWHVKGRYMGWWQMNRSALFAVSLAGLGIGMVIGAVGGFRVGHVISAPPSEELIPVEINSSGKVVGVLRSGFVTSVLLEDGRIVPATVERKNSQGHFFQVGKQWHRFEY